MKLLAVGDLHLGRLPSRLPEDLNHKSHKLGPAGAWQRVVDKAIDENVDVVVLAGDVADNDRDFFEAYRQLHTDVSTLAQAGINVLGVAGNHDVSLLPRLANELRGFRLVGHDGQWERVDLNEQVTLWGWSFPQREVRQSPLANVPPCVEGRVNLGVLHCDRDQANSRYAPVTSPDLVRTGWDGWLLGHIHKPDPLSMECPCGYLGSVSGTDPGEPGPHGPWLITIENNRIQAVEQWVLAPLRWEAMEVDLTPIAEPDEVDGRLLEKVRDLDVGLNQLPCRPNAVGLRVSLAGSTNLGAAAYDHISEQQSRIIHTGEGGILYFVEYVHLETSPEVNLQELANEPSPAGLLARRLLQLKSDEANEECASLVDKAWNQILEEHRNSRWRALGVPEPDANAVKDLLRDAGMRLLDRMLAQRREEAQ